ncbi:MAG: PspC domain-containing protein [Cytophagales bacterium]|nr:PspC domain-containing protein [Cytophagales bacterium]MCA6386891.1 PspC domain-containing protein [Cytophagales bacterium]MCA6393413.1 PspC domain-containing protein [Cytophagales bacterium]MCA6394852.1 PspC domain-containing protein [Cytophagales bacterium]MCA6400106.1 PspC domain-containing protein [Cytophagales bacterium]
MAATKKLVKSERKIFGVCSGLANYFDTDPTIVRILFVAAFFGFGMGLLAYVVMALIMPEK